jgi:hypothetical protein
MTTLLSLSFPFSPFHFFHVHAYGYEKSEKTEKPNPDKRMASCCLFSCRFSLFHYFHYHIYKVKKLKKSHVIASINMMIISYSYSTDNDGRE